MRVPKGEESKKFLKTMTADFYNLVKEIDINVQRGQKVPNQRNQKRPTPRHITIKMTKVKGKERILKAAREKQLPTRELP